MTRVIAGALEQLAARQALDPRTAEAAVLALLDQQASAIETSSFLTALAVKGITADELEGAVHAVRSRMSRLDASRFSPLIDTCGVGGDRSGTLNISTGAALLAAAAGARIVKHGNRAASSRTGSSDVLEALGVAPDPAAADPLGTLEHVGIAYLHAPRFHPGLGAIAPVRRALPFRTLFNLVGPLCNPASPRFQLIGCSLESQAELMARVLARLEHLERALVVHGEDGLDEVTLATSTRAWLVEQGAIRTLSFTPADFGLAPAPIEPLIVNNAQESAARLLAVFQGARDPARDYLVANAAAALWTAGLAPDLKSAAELASRTLDSGAVRQLLERWRTIQPA